MTEPTDLATISDINALKAMVLDRLDQMTMLQQEVNIIRERIGQLSAPSDPQLPLESSNGKVPVEA